MGDGSTDCPLEGMRDVPLEALLPFITFEDAYMLMQVSKEWNAKIFCSHVWDSYFEVIFSQAESDFCRWLSPFLLGPEERPNPFVAFAKQAIGLRGALEKFTPIYKSATLSAVNPVPRLTKETRECASIIRRPIMLLGIIAARRRVKKFEEMSEIMSKYFIDASLALDVWEKQAEILGNQGLVDLEDSREVCLIVKEDLIPPTKLFSSACRMAGRAGHLLRSLEIIVRGEEEAPEKMLRVEVEAPTLLC